MKRWSRLDSIEIWLLAKMPEVLIFGGAVFFTLIGIGMLLGNPGGNWNRDAATYGPDAPLQTWVLVVALSFFAIAGILLVLAVVNLCLRIRMRRAGRHKHLETAAADGSESPE